MLRVFKKQDFSSTRFLFTPELNLLRVYCIYCYPYRHCKISLQKLNKASKQNTNISSFHFCRIIIYKETQYFNQAFTLKH